MMRISVTINDKLEFDGDPGEWASTPPDFLKDVIKVDGRPQPHMQGVAMAMTNAVMRHEPTSINVKTWTDGWTMTVKKLGNGKRKLK